MYDAVSHPQLQTHSCAVESPMKLRGWDANSDTSSSDRARWGWSKSNRAPAQVKKRRATSFSVFSNPLSIEVQLTQQRVLWRSSHRFDSAPVVWYQTSNIPCLTRSAHHPVQENKNAAPWTCHNDVSPEGPTARDLCAMLPRTPVSCKCFATVAMAMVSLFRGPAFAFLRWCRGDFRGLHQLADVSGGNC